MKRNYDYGPQGNPHIDTKDEKLVREWLEAKKNRADPVPLRPDGDFTDEEEDTEFRLREGDALMGVVPWLIAAVVFVLILAAILLTGCSAKLDDIIPPVHAATSAPAGRISFELVQASENNAYGEFRGADKDVSDCGTGGSAFTGNLSVWFAQGHSPVLYAWWIATVIPNDSGVAGRKGGVRLFAYDDVNTAKVVIAEMYSTEQNPRPFGGWVQDQLNGFITAGSVYKYIGVEICGPARLYTSKISILV